MLARCAWTLLLVLTSCRPAAPAPAPPPPPARVLAAAEFAEGRSAAEEFRLKLVKQDFSLDAKPREGVVTAQVTLSVENRGGEPAAELFAYLTDAAELSEVKSPDRTVTWERLPAAVPFFSAVRVRFAEPIAAGARVALRFAYRLARTMEQSGLGAMSTRLGPDEMYLFECWYPTLEPFIDSESFVQKVQKAPFTMTITTPNGFRGVTAGVPGESLTGAGPSTFTYRGPSPPPFLIPFLVGRFEEVRLTSDVPVPVTLYAKPPCDKMRAAPFGSFVARAAAAQARALGREAPDGVTIVFMESGGIARGFPELLVLPPYILNAWEEPRIKATICHELAHTYFGNLVTAHGPGGNEFLAEGMATFMGIKTIELLDGPEVAAALFHGERETFFTSEVEDVAIEQVRPMQNVLSGEVYRKGALVVRELGRWIGEAELWKLLGAYIARNAGGFATLADFRRLAPEFAGRELGPFFTQYLETTALPWVELAGLASARDEKTGRYRTEVRLRNRGNGFGLAPVALRARDGSAVEGSPHSFFVEAGKEQTFAVETSVEVGSCVVDPDGTFLHGVRRASMLARAAGLRQKGEHARARLAYRELLAILPEDGEVWYGLGRVEESASATDEAIACYDKAARFAGPPWLPTWAWLRAAACHDARGEREKAKELLERVLTKGNDVYDAFAEARKALEKHKE